METMLDRILGIFGRDPKCVQCDQLLTGQGSAYRTHYYELECNEFNPSTADPRTTPSTIWWRGKIYFCNAKCLREWIERPRLPENTRPRFPK